mmetsp:Transcript_108797/g.209044  ORF Transcript_108797/g.209044 Transcript_108797/m.209044 type:complete len:859 (-) Transcript_108797:30-2606(-)
MAAPMALTRRRRAPVGDKTKSFFELQRTVPDRRLPSVAVLRVEMRMYRRSRTASDVLRKPPHFEYIMRWTWTGRPSTLSSGKRGALAAALVSWWDALPASYEVRRRWCDIVKMHEELAAIYTGHNMPELPSKGDLNAFMQAVAATGDSQALSRKWGSADESALDDLTCMHIIYVENRLAPYFAEVSKVLQSLPTDVLQDSSALRQFATGGPSSLRRAPPSTKALLLSPEEVSATAQALRQSNSLPVLSGLSKSASDENLETTTPTSAASPSALSSPMAERTRGGRCMANPNAAAKFQEDDAGQAGGARANSAESAAAAAQARQRSRERSRERAAERERERRRRLDLSHYGFFARQVPAKAVTRPSTRDWWRQMVVKERRELSRRSMLANSLEPDEMSMMGPKSASAVSFADPARLPSLPPSKMSSTSNTPRSSSTWSTSMHSRSLDRLPSLKTSVMPNPEQIMMARASQIEASRAQICEGMRCIMLKMKPLQIPRRERKYLDMAVFMSDHRFGSEQETLTIYKIYRRLLKMDGEEEGDADASSGDEVQEPVPEEVKASIQARMSESNRSGRVNFKQETLHTKELMPVTWPTIFMWVQQKIDFEQDSVVKSVCKTLMRALKVWRDYQATPAQSYYGVSLNMLLQWTWPCATYEDLAQMLSKICLHEMEPIRQPSPQVISVQDHRQLERIFKGMDGQSRGVLTAEDIAGGEPPLDLETTLRNIVEPHIVKEVCGEGDISPTQFLELMCEDNYRAHEGAKRVLLADGRRIVEVERKATGFHGWLLEEVPKCEEERRRRVDALEAEVIRYRRLANQRRSVLVEDIRPNLAKPINAYGGLVATDGFFRQRRRSRSGSGEQDST